MRRKIISLFIVSLLLFAFGYVLTNSVQYGLCFSKPHVSDPSCINLYERIGDPLFYGFGALSLVFLALLVVPRAIPTWKKFAKWFIPIATLIFIFYPDPGSGDLFSPYPEQVFQWISVLYVVVSVFIIGLSLSREKSKN